MADMKQMNRSVECGKARRTLNYDQVRRLTEVVDSEMAVPGRGNYPTLNLTVRRLVLAVRQRLEKDGMRVNDVRINGGAASYIVIGDSCGDQVYNDLDIIFRLDDTGTTSDRSGRTPYDLDQVKDSALLSLLDFLPPEVNRGRLKPGVISEAYLKKMVKIDHIWTGSTDGDCWSLISLDNNIGRTVEMKFVVRMRRQYEFSIDSFQVILDGFLQFFDISPPAPEPEERFYPTVIAESAYGDIEAAIGHATHRLIATRNPEQVRGGGLLKYCWLVAREYQTAKDFETDNLDRYMCTRFFIDFPDPDRQMVQLENYLLNHFFGDMHRLRIRWLSVLRSVISRGANCLSCHRRQQTLGIINHLIDVEHRSAAAMWSAIQSPASEQSRSHVEQPSDDSVTDSETTDKLSWCGSESEQSESSCSSELQLPLPEMSPVHGYAFGTYGYGPCIPAMPFGSIYYPCFPVYLTPSPMLPAFVQRS